MLDMNEIEKEITKLENCDCTSYNICSKLATLYIVRDHYKPSKVSPTAQSMSAPTMSNPMK